VGAQIPNANHLFAGVESHYVVRVENRHGACAVDQKHHGPLVKSTGHRSMGFSEGRVGPATALTNVDSSDTVACAIANGEGLLRLHCVTPRPEAKVQRSHQHRHRGSRYGESPTRH
jgi:hypothetical protein